MNKRLWCVSAGLCAALIVLASVQAGTSESQVRDGLRAVADEFQPESGWILEQESVSGQLMCTGWDASCNTMFRTYRTNALPTDAEVRGLADKAGWQLQFDQACALPERQTGTEELCSGTGTANGYSVAVQVSSAWTGGPTIITAQVTKLR